VPSNAQDVYVCVCVCVCVCVWIVGYTLSLAAQTLTTRFNQPAKVHVSQATSEVLAFMASSKSNQ
jgi:hypothetical protein